MVAVLNPYAGRKQRPASFVRMTSLMLGLVVIGLMSRGYHSRKTRAIRGGKKNTTVKKQSSLINAFPNGVGSRRNAQPGPSKSTWKSVDQVSESFGAAAEDAGGWIQNKASNVMGKEMANEMGNMVGSGFDQVGEFVDTRFTEVGDLVKQIGNLFERESIGGQSDEDDDDEEDDEIGFDELQDNEGHENDSVEQDFIKNLDEKESEDEEEDDDDDDEEDDEGETENKAKENEGKGKEVKEQEVKEQEGRPKVIQQLQESEAGVAPA